MSKEINWYELLQRPLSPVTFPNDAFTSDLNHVNVKGRPYGAIAYARELTPSDVDSYELNPISAPRELFDWELMILNK